jgi:hypothetical protein
MTETNTMRGLDVSTSADSLETTGAITPANALGVTKRMKDYGNGSNQSGGLSDSLLLDRLQEFADELGRTPTSTEMDRDGPHTARTYQKHFGSWNEALDEADLTRNRDRGESDQKMLDALRNLASELGETPTAEAMDVAGRYSASAYIRRFGSWNAALSQAGFELNKASHGDGEYGLGWNDNTRETVRNRQDRECLDCGISESEYKSQAGTRLDVHHVIREEHRGNPVVYNAPRNLVALCRGCHLERHGGT